MNDVVNFINDVANKIFNFVMGFLPDSFIAGISLPEPIIRILGYVNYYIPIQEMINIALGWISCIGVYYCYQLVLRKINGIS